MVLPVVGPFKSVMQRGAVLEEEIEKTSIVETKDKYEEIETDPISNYIEEIEEDSPVLGENILQEEDNEEEDTKTFFNAIGGIEDNTEEDEMYGVEDEASESLEEFDSESEQENTKNISNVVSPRQEAKHFKLGNSSASAKYSVKKQQTSEKDSDLKDFEEQENSETQISGFKEVISTGVMNMEKEEILENGVKKLFGWLVSYATPEGKAIEIRESKFFITNKALKQNDLIVNDRSVSTPHAMVHVTRSGGFLVQDLMSDRGMFIRRRGSDTYQKEESIVKCGHGDWLRIGDVEYLLTVVGDIGK